MYTFKCIYKIYIIYIQMFTFVYKCIHILSGVFFRVFAQCMRLKRMVECLVALEWYVYMVYMWI